MPYTLKTQQISVKDPDSGEYIGVDVLAEQNKESLIAEIQSEGDLQVERVDQKAAEILAAGDTQVTRINQTGTNVQNLVNQEEARAQQIVTDAQTSLNTLEAQKNTIAETVASMAELGTDTTLTTPGMAADAKAVGDVKGEVDNLGDFVYDQDSGLSTKAPAITDSASSGDIVTFESDVAGGLVSKLKGTIEPIQDLHGYDYPWPGGSGVNLCVLTANTQTISGVTFTVNSDGTITMNGTATASANFIMGTVNLPSDTYVLNAFVELPSGCTINAASHGTRQATEFTDSVSGNVFLYVASGTVVSNVVVKPALYLKSVGMSTFQPYSNICPITGYTEANVSATGINVWDEEWEVGQYRPNTGEKTDNSNNIRSKNFIPCKPNTTYCFVWDGWSAWAEQVLFYDADYSFITGANKSFALLPATFTTPATAYYMTFFAAGASTYNNNISINYPATDTTYHPYAGATIQVSFPTEAGTVYSGTIDPISGKIASTMGMMDMGTLDFSLYNSTASRDAYRAKIDVVRPADNVPINALSSIYKAVAYNASWTPGTMSSSHQLGEMVFCTKPGEYADATAFKAAMSGAQLCYELATPIEYQLTPVEVKTLLGTNNIWLDTGSITECVYPKDTKKYVDNKTVIKAPVIINHAEGEIASFTDGAEDMPVKSLVASIEPVQDLHGYSNPWPDGGMGNLFSANAKTSDVGIVYTLDDDGTLTLNGTSTGNADFQIPLLHTIPVAQGDIVHVKFHTISGNYGNQTCGVFLNSYAERGYITSNLWTAITVEATTEINIIVLRFYAGASLDNYKCKITLDKEPTVLSQWYPYSNICPISGHTGMTVARTGKNLFDQSQLLQATDWSLNSDGYYTGKRTYLNLAFSNGFPILPKFDDNTQYTISLTEYNDSSTSATMIRIRYTDNATDLLLMSATTPTLYTITTRSDKTVQRIEATFGSNGDVNAFIKDFQLEKGTTASTYEPYTGTTIPITWETEAGTVYGGTVDAVSGKMIVDRKMVDLGSLTWNGVYSEPLKRKYANLGDNKNISAKEMPEKALCTALKIVTANAFDADTNVPNTICINNNYNRLWVRLISESGDPDYNALLSGVELVYELTEPIEYQLTPSELTTLLGTNNIWTDAGSVSVDYSADTKLFIQNAIAEALSNSSNP